MDFKKLAAGAVAGAALLAVVTPAFADFDGTSIRNRAKVKNFTLTVANTGLNSMNAGDDIKGGKIKTGDAMAVAEVTNVVNSTSVDTCGCDEDGLRVRNKAKVKNVTLTFANTGLNSMNAGDDIKGGKIKTGDAGAASVVTNVVNTTVVGDGEVL